MKKAKDFHGQELNVGDLVVFTTQPHQSLKESKILDIKEDHISLEHYRRHPVDVIKVPKEILMERLLGI